MWSLFTSRPRWSCRHATSGCGILRISPHTRTTKKKAPPLPSGCQEGAGFIGCEPPPGTPSPRDPAAPVVRLQLVEQRRHGPLADGAVGPDRSSQTLLLVRGGRLVPRPGHAVHLARVEGVSDGDTLRGHDPCGLDGGDVVGVLVSRVAGCGLRPVVVPGGDVQLGLAWHFGVEAVEFGDDLVDLDGAVGEAEVDGCLSAAVGEPCPGGGLFAVAPFDGLVVGEVELLPDCGGAAVGCGDEGEVVASVGGVEDVAGEAEDFVVLVWGEDDGG